VPAVEDSHVWSYSQPVVGKREYSSPIAFPVAEVGVGLKSSPNWVVNGIVGVEELSKLMKINP